MVLHDLVYQKTHHLKRCFGKRNIWRHFVNLRFSLKLLTMDLSKSKIQNKRQTFLSFRYYQEKNDTTPNLKNI